MEEEKKEPPQNRETEQHKAIRFMLIRELNEGSFGVAWLARLYDDD
jgi:hypothetical protein